VPAGNADIDGADLIAGDFFGFLHRLFYGLHGAVDVYHDPPAQALGGAGTDTDDIDSLIGEFADDGTGLGGADVQTDDDVRFFSHACLPLSFMS